MEALRGWLIDLGVRPEHAAILDLVVASVLLLLAAAVAYFVAKNIILVLVRAAARRSKTTWDDALVRAKVFSRLTHIVPAMVIYRAAPVVFAGTPGLQSAVTTLTFVYMAVAGMLVFDSVLNGALAIYQTYEVSRRVHVFGTLVQVTKVTVYCLGGLAVVAILLGKSPLVMISGLGAFTAILLLIFKDSILGLVAGVQLSAYRMVQRGDWIEMPSHGADGDVLEVNLTTVKVQNFDKTIVTIPTYALVSESFRNWRGMEESGGRRIKRAVQIDVTSIKFCDAEMIERFKRIDFISDYVAAKHAELAEYNSEQVQDDSLLVNGRHMTNVGTFRAYLEAYLRNHPKIDTGMTFLVRQLPLGDRGLPIEIYVFSNDQNWTRYEAIQADIFDHLLAVVPLFDLRVFQSPTGADLRALRSKS